MEDVIQHTKWAFRPLAQIKANPEDPFETLTVWHSLRNGCFSVQICSSWALLLANVDIAQSWYQTRIHLHESPADQSWSFQLQCFSFSILCNRKRNYFPIFGCVYADSLFLYLLWSTMLFLLAFKPWLYILPQFVFPLSVIFLKDLWCHF